MESKLKFSYWNVLELEEGRSEIWRMRRLLFPSLDDVFFERERERLSERQFYFAR